MKKYIIANWKSNKTPQEAEIWLETLMGKLPKNFSNRFEVVVCAPFIDIPILREMIRGTKLKLGAQNISPFHDGPHTGEVSARLVSGFVSHVILGHSERRRNFYETDEIVAKKTILAVAQGLIPIICISQEEEIVNWKNLIKNKIGREERDQLIFAYEPLSAIGTGNPEDPQQADDFIKDIKIEYGIKKCIYGGSVSGENVNSFIRQNHTDGVLIGSASLKVDSFLEVLRSAAY